MIEDIILSNDRKGISRLKKYLSNNFCEKAAECIAQNLSRTLVLTGFYVDGTCETDGLASAISLAKVLKREGSQVTFVTDKYCSYVLKRLSNSPVINFPIDDKAESFSENLIRKLSPTLIISIERCGKSEDGRYYNFILNDITNNTSKLDTLFDKVEHSIAIGDTGNEIGMGNLFEEIKKEKVFLMPSTTKAEHLVISSTSNWGVYGLISYISKFLKKDYFYNIKDKEIIMKLVNFGAIDGISEKNEPTVDTYTLEETEEIIKELGEFIYKKRP